MRFTFFLLVSSLAAPLHTHHNHQRDEITTESDIPSNPVLGDLSPFTDPTIAFEDGVHSCDQVPVGQGVVAVDWISALNGGWSSIMALDGSTSETCQEGFFCSYACQAGMSKTQWPENQPADGRTVGGLQCRNGKLYRSNPNYENLCIWGAETAFFKSEVSQNISICRTDYPGSENMNIPTLLSAESSQPCSVVDGETYFKWLGNPTSTQYYVNNAGVSIEDGCIWGDDESKVGNWAPLVAGSGIRNGLTYLSIFPNPNNHETPNFNVKIVPGPDSNVVGECKYENGIYSGGPNGCTVTVVSGTAEFVFY